MLKGKKVSSKTNAPTVEDSTSTEEDNPSVAVEEIQKSTSPTTRSKSALKDSTPISSPTPSVVAEKNSEINRTKNEIEEIIRRFNINFNTNKPYRSGFHAINEFVNKHLEEDGEVRKKKDPEKVWFTDFQLEKKKEILLSPVLDVFVHKKAEKKEENKMKKTNWPVRIHKYLMDSIRIHIDSPLKVNGCMYLFAEHNNSMMPINEQGFPRFLRWVISDMSNTIEKDINEDMKKMQPGWVKSCSDEQQQILDEYRENSFIEEKSKKVHAADPRNVENDKDLVDLFVDTLQEIISFNKELKREDERDDDEQEEEEGEKGGKGKKGGDLHDDSDDDDEEEEDEEGGNGGDLHEDDNDKEGSKGGDEEDRTESEKNKVPSENSKKQSSTSTKANEGNEEKDMEDESEYDKVVSLKLLTSRDSQQLENVVQLELNKKRALKGDAPIESHEINIMQCAAQGINPDCLLYTCYFMKRSMKKRKSIERDQQRAEAICQEMGEKLVEKMLKKVGVYEKVWDIAKDEEQKQWRLRMEKNSLKRKKSF
ncbi:nucleolar transcription factor 1-B-like [Papaver somniferum]|uniref:nucleolar transcription factor 1-B-like n=1 Tax=Papaver somniferum TaxID=3469 RepID=UPI000E7042DB|nr:nucleolar transcription factor 1-B-like [Papaver somniferum]